MIVKMKSVAVIGLESHGESILEELREIGVVHVRHVKPPEGRSLEELDEEIGKASAALNLLPEAAARARAGEEGKLLVDKLFHLGEKRRSLEEELGQLRREASRVGFLGDFRPRDVQALAEKGVRLRLYACTPRRLAEIPPDLAYAVVGERDKKKVFAVVSYGEDRDVLFEPIPIPTRSVSEINELVRLRQEELGKVQSEIESLAPYRAEVRQALVDLENQRDLERVRAGRGAAQEVVYVTGFCPVPHLSKLRHAAERSSWGLVIDDPADDEEPPTLIQNPGWIRIIDPVFQFIKTFPGYREFDISLWFLLFFSVFFAMLIGDGGYGLIYLAITGFAHAKLRKKVPYREPFLLMYVLSACTILWGALTGNWFGVEAISRVSPFKEMIVPSLNAFSNVSQATVIHICFVIGAVQLTIGHLMAAFRYLNSLKAVEQIGWILILWSAYFLACLFVLKHDLPSFFTLLLASGVGLVLLTIVADGRKRKHAPIAIWDLFMSSISAFADTMSYIRLFAVGLATLAVAQSFNQMASAVGFGGVFSGFGASLILVLGHALNIVLALMAVVVHGVRLNMLEFSGHVGNTWSGYDYRPFEKKAVD